MSSLKQGLLTTLLTPRPHHLHDQSIKAVQRPGQVNLHPLHARQYQFIGNELNRFTQKAGGAIRAR